MILAPRHPATRMIAIAAAVPFAILLILLTLQPVRVEDAAPGLVDGVLTWFRDTLGAYWLTESRAEKLANAALFVPVGVLATLILPRAAWPAALLLGPALSCTIELTQFVFLSERVASPIDILANSLGATGGVALAVLCTVATSVRTAPRARPA